MKKIFITGHKGSIGSNIDKFIKNTNKYKVIYSNKKSYKDLKKCVEQADIIINCVGEFRDKKNFTNANYRYVKSILKIININKKKKFLIHISSCSVYEGIKKNIISDKEKNLNPKSIYAKTKLLGDQIILDHSQKKYFSFHIIRLPQVLGNNLENSSLIKLKKIFKFNLAFLLLSSNYFYNYILINDLKFFIIKLLEENDHNKITILSRNIKYQDLMKNFYKKEIKFYMIKTFLSDIFQIFLKTLSIFRLNNIKFINALTNKKIYLSSKRLKQNKDIEFKTL